MSSDTIAAYWWPYENNWGDQFSRVILKVLSGKEPELVTSGGNRFLAIGSILHEAQPGDCIWGTGSWMNDTPAVRQKLSVTAVRGPLTRNIFLQQGMDCPAIYGDPGILVRYVYAYERTSEYAIGVLPHYSDRALIEEALPRLYESKNPSIRYIDITSGIEPVIREVLRCRKLVTSSLHGVIVGEAFDIPTVAVRLSDSVAGGAFKFADYYQSTGRTLPDLTPVSVDVSLSSFLGKLADRAESFGKPVIDANRLLRACPFNYCGYQNVEDLPRITL